MKNQNKKSKRVNIECVEDLVDALIGVEEKANGQLADLGVASSVKVEEGVDLVNVKVDDKIFFSMKVTDVNASSAFGPLKNALERAKKSVMPKVEEPEVVADALPKAERPERKGFKKMDMTDFKQQLDSVVTHANERLVEIRGRDIADVAVCFVFDGAACVVKSGDREIAREDLSDVFGAFRSCRAAIWQRVDDIKRTRQERPERPRQESIRESGTFADRLASLLSEANAKLSALGEPALVVTTDSVGVYVAAGNLPLCSLPKGIGDASAALKKLSEKVWAFVDSTRGAVERRTKDAARASEIEADSGWDLAVIAKNCPGLDVSEPWKLGPNPEAATAIVEAAKKAVKAFNASLRFKFEEVSALLGTDAMRLTLKGFTRGLVVLCGENPCLVTNFPLVANNATTEEAATYVTTTVAAIGSSRMAFYARLAEEQARQEKLRSLAARKDALEAEVSALAM